MIPPVQSIRLKSISRYLTDTQPKQYGRGHQTAVLKSRATEIDKQMVRDFEVRENKLMEHQMKQGTWGTASGLPSFQTDRMTLWHEVVEQHLPVTTEQAPEI